MFSRGAQEEGEAQLEVPHPAVLGAIRDKGVYQPTNNEKQEFNSAHVYMGSEQASEEQRLMRPPMTSSEYLKWLRRCIHDMESRSAQQGAVVSSSNITQKGRPKPRPVARSHEQTTPSHGHHVSVAV
jgi:hypothetical protein